MQQDMIVGNPTKIIIKFTIPIFIGNVFQQFYSMVDTIIVGKFVGNEALAAVGACGTLVFLIIGFLLGMTSGFTVVTAQHYGAGNMNAVRKSVASGAVLTAIVSLFLTTISMTFMKQILYAMNTPDDMFQEAYSYMMIICAGIAAQALYNLLSSILRAVGDSKRPLYFLIIAALLNIVLDLVFILVFKMGVAGAALATVISQGISGLLCLLYIWKNVKILHLSMEDWRLDGNLINWQLRLGFPMALQFSITAIGTIFVQSALNKFGTVIIAAFSAAIKIEQILTQAMMALGTTMATFCAQNIGANRIERIRQGFKSTTIIGVVYSVIAGGLVFFVGKYLTVLFVSNNLAEITGYVDIYLKIVGVSFIPLMIVCVYRSGIQGMGYGLLPMTAGIAELVGRVGAAYVASYYVSYAGICFAGPAAWILAALLLLVMYFYIMKKRMPKNVSVV